MNDRIDWLKKNFLLELSLAVVLGAAYFYFVKDYAVGIPGNTTNAKIFISGSASCFQVDQIFDVWKGRLSGLLLSGCLFDLLVSHTSGSFEQFSFAFGLYQAFWLFLLFLVVILGLRHSLFINLGIFLGVMYNFFPVCGLYFYPWDIPATLFFTLAVLFFERRQTGLMVATICAGCFFKETVLVCALLVFFAGQWKWWRQLLTFAGIIAVYVIGKKLLLHELHLSAAALSMNDSKNLSEIFHIRLLIENLQILFSANGLYVLFANAGTLAAVLLFGWQRRFWPYMVLVLAFLVGQAMYGGFLEFRIFMQLLPLSLMILCERYLGQRSANKKGGGFEDFPPSESVSVWSWRETSLLLKPIAVLLIVISTALVAWCFLVVLEKTNEEKGKHKASDASIENLKAKSAWFKNAGADTDLKLSRMPRSKNEKQTLELADGWFGNEYCTIEIKLGEMLQSLGRAYEAIEHYQNAMRVLSYGKKSSFAVDNDLAWLLATASDPSLRNGRQAVLFAEEACQLTEYKIPIMIGTLAAAYAEAGQFSNAVAACQKARDLALELGQKNVAENNEQLLKLYQSGKAYHEGEVATPPTAPK